MWPALGWVCRRVGRILCRYGYRILPTSVGAVGAVGARRARGRRGTAGNCADCRDVDLGH